MRAPLMSMRRPLQQYVGDDAAVLSIICARQFVGFPLLAYQKGVINAADTAAADEAAIDEERDMKILDRAMVRRITVQALCGCENRQLH